MKSHAAAIFFVMGLLLQAVSAPEATALVVTNHTNTVTLNAGMPNEETVLANYVAPTLSGNGDPGWANLSGDGRSSIYLGNGWVITARHIGNPSISGGAGAVYSSITLDAGTDENPMPISYNIIPNSGFELNNPAGLQFIDHFGNPITTTPANVTSDIVMFRINTLESGSPEQNAATYGASIQDITIASNSPGENTPITILSSGTYKDIDTRFYYDDDTSPWTEYAMNVPGVTDVEGFSHYNNNLNIRRRAWGVSQTERETLFPGQPNNPDDNLVLRVINRDTIMRVANFDIGGSSSNQAMPVPGDSGGGVFYQDNGEWRLLGVLHSTYGFGNPNNTATDGQVFAFSDFTDPDYQAQILAALSSTEWSAIGDINLDGVVSGDGTGDAASDDVTAFVDGWNEQFSHSSLEAGILSWSLGDLDQNAIVDQADFLLLRESLGAGGASLNFAQLIGGGNSVPEPSTLVTLSICGVAALAWRLRRRYL